jgi:hypothetical protein
VRRIAAVPVASASHPGVSTLRTGPGCRSCTRLAVRGTTRRSTPTRRARTNSAGPATGWCCISMAPAASASAP